MSHTCSIAPHMHIRQIYEEGDDVNWSCLFKIQGETNYRSTNGLKNDSHKSKSVKVDDFSDIIYILVHKIPLTDSFLCLTKVSCCICEQSARKTNMLMT